MNYLQLKVGKLYSVIEKPYGCLVSKQPDAWARLAVGDVVVVLRQDTDNTPLTVLTPEGLVGGMWFGEDDQLRFEELTLCNI